MPSASYSYLGFGGDVDVPLLTSRFGSRFGAVSALRLDLMTGTGDVKQFGTDASAWGLDFDAGVRARNLPFGLRAATLFTYSHIGLGYSGAPASGGPVAQSGGDNFYGVRLTVAKTF
jgi:hypothetical protein